ncbi:cell wall hydrolase [Sphingomonas sinipercae]|uniref:Cell wall hydrolase n=1 Tax=Sphingomonas sinipercae TaxID=2714944 RepID=A0A6G7ZMH4_9SPHN|nr:cell wall hydrolase [Sphingomonas sinipercae]QIL02184.1 cell wall hydrolase [Sphingomonas sinipercae]
MIATNLSPARLWQQHPRELIALGGVAAAILLTAGGAAWSSPGLSGFSREQVAAATPAPPPMLVRNVAPEEALALNGKIPVASGPNPAAAPFSMAGLTPAAKARALECLSSAVYYEAGQESDDGQRAVAQVVLNRLRHPAFPSTVCGVVYQGSTRATGCQFTFTCDGSLQRRPDSEGWARASRVAYAALNGAVYAPAGWATHYHANYVLPYWASSLVKNAVVGAHLFYRWSGGWGRPPAFSQRYAKQEPDSLALRTAALAAFGNRSAETPLAVADLEAEAEKAVEEIPGAKIQKADAGRIAIRFDLAKAAVENATHKPYIEKAGASDNLRWTLSKGLSSDEAPLGKAAAPAGAASSN